MSYVFNLSVTFFVIFVFLVFLILFFMNFLKCIESEINFCCDDVISANPVEFCVHKFSLYKYSPNAGR